MNKPKKKHSIKFTQPSMTKQNHKAECDINKIMAKYQKTGIINHLQNHGAEYGEYSPIDFQEAMELIARGQSMFEDLPSSARKYFDNDPAQFMKAFHQEGNEDTFRDLGLLGPATITKTPDQEVPKEPQSEPEKSA